MDGVFRSDTYQIALAYDPDDAIVRAHHRHTADALSVQQSCDIADRCLRHDSNNVGRHDIGGC